MNRFSQALMRLFAAPRINMREDYPKIRRIQQRLARKPRGYLILDRKIYSATSGHDIPVRVFHPKVQRHGDVLVFFHGGGWVIGDIDYYTPTCAAMADLTGRVVYSVCYRLAPEHPYPAGLDDCYQVAFTMLNHPEVAGVCRSTQISLIGDSAGGNLAAAVSLRLRDAGQAMPANQVLLYPLTQPDHDPRTSSFESVREYGTGLRLTAQEVADYMYLYAPDPSVRCSPFISPLLAGDLTGMPRTLVLTAELDLLRDEGEAFGHALGRAGVPVRVDRIYRAAHGYITLPRFSRSVRRAYAVIDDFLNSDPGRGRRAH